MDSEERGGPNDIVGATGHARHRLSVSRTNLPLRVSVEDHFRRHSLVMGTGRVALAPNCAQLEPPEEPLDIPPPPYDATLPIPLLSNLRRKFNVQPREDEGQEVLPPYSCAISLENVFLRKMELEGAVHRAHDRNWYPVLATLQGTALTFHKTKSGNVFAKIEGGTRKHDSPAGVKRVQVIKSYNLQHAEVGVAADYTKKRFVIRIRAEADQFLLSCHKIETFVIWLQSLFAAIDLATPLDDRDLPSDVCVPRPRRRRGNNQRNGGQGQDQDMPVADDTLLGSSDTGEESEGENLVLVTASLLATPAESPQSRPRSRAGRAPNRLLQTHGPNLQAYQHHPPSSTTNPSINPETGKWRPRHQWTPFSDMLYAKRCMAILTSESPRKSNLLIMKGKRWVVDWGSGTLRKWVPEMESGLGLPDYAEGDTRGGAKEQLWRVSQFGELVRL
ncbi:uncharacterized protein BP5553_00721 [Venustampulla echinocandica]|uniref:PH domain-containing protein n=1 Tax=Venustampulla echinocandica TaxID=2656787 RepID=A0A370TYY8_9HELO|nr:uncharacterized protein BP5553_00721 [Venustampulla echinocandica]RDL40742.1 hypothetical protein BP5553_00721 [Venustampulla echinocandica]